MRQLISLLEAKRMLRLVVLVLAAVVAASMVASTVGLDSADAKKKKKKKKKPAATITCVANKPCNGNSANNTMNGTDSDDLMDGHEGNDTHNPKKNNYFNDPSSMGDLMTDSSSKSNDIYNLPGSSDGVYFVDDKAGSNDLVNLSPLNASDEGFMWGFVGSGDFTGDGTEDVLILFYNDDDLENYLLINDFFGNGTTGLQFADDTITESDISGSSAALNLPASSSSDEAVSIPHTR